MSEKLHCFATKKVGDEWVDVQPKEVGHILPDGTIENTPYQFHGRHVNGGVAVTKYGTMEQANHAIVNPATGEVFYETQKGSGYFNRKLGIFIRAWMRSNDHE